MLTLLRKTITKISIILLLFGITACSQPIPPISNIQENLLLGNPDSSKDASDENENFLIERDSYALSYNNITHNPNWVSWHLDKQDFMYGVDRQNSFREDDSLPADWYKVDSSSFKGSGFHRGHMCPSGDKLDSIESNDETFFMTNMIPQCPENNSGAWQSFESYIRNVHISKGNEAYIICGPYGSGGESSYHKKITELYATCWNDNGDSERISINVPSHTWKVVIILPEADGDDISRITEDTEIFAVWMPNSYECEYYPFNPHLVSVDYVEEMTGYDFFSNIPDEIENALESRIHAPVNYKPYKPWDR